MNSYNFNTLSIKITALCIVYICIELLRLLQGEAKTCRGYKAMRRISNKAQRLKLESLMYQTRQTFRLHPAKKRLNLEHDVLKPQTPFLRQSSRAPQRPKPRRRLKTAKHPPRKRPSLGRCGDAPAPAASTPRIRADSTLGGLNVRALTGRLRIIKDFTSFSPLIVGPWG